MKVGVDGSKFEANASKHRSVRYDRAEELIEQLRLEIADCPHQYSLSFCSQE